LACSDLPSLDCEDVAELERLSRGIFAG
jgi:hypothetical protein